MNSLEDRVRAATRAQAQTLREVGPLRLSPAPARRAIRRRRWRGWLAPTTAAALVIAIAVALVVVRDIPNGRAIPQGTAASSVPPYYAAIDSQPGTSPSTSRLVIGDTLTGARLATIAPPRGRWFAGVTGASDDRTFVVSTRLDAGNGSTTLAVTWYLLRIAPGGTPAYRLTRLAIPDMGSWGVQTIALSGSGRQLAMTVFPPKQEPGRQDWGLRIYSVATGKLLRAWSANDWTYLSLVTLSWVDGDRAVAFPTFEVPKGTAASTIRESERLIEVTAPGGDLLAHSRVIWSTQTTAGAYAPARCLGGARVTADGKTVVCVTGPVGSTTPGNGQVTLEWLTYLTSAPTVPRVLYKVTVDAPSSDTDVSGVLWSDPSGSTFIIEWAVARSITASTVHFGVVSHGQFRPLPSLPVSVPADLSYGLTVAW